MVESTYQPEQPIPSNEPSDEERVPVDQYLNHVAPYQKQQKRSKTKRIILIILILVILLGAAGYWFFVRKKPSKSNQNTPSPQVQTQNKPTTTQPAEVATKHYTSSTLFLDLDYPENWTVDDSKSSELQITSPIVDLKDVSGQSFSGKVRVTIHSTNVPLVGFDKGNAVAVRDSEKITYTKPTERQRAQTYISFLRLVTSPVSDLLDAIYITGDFGYKTGQAVPKADVAKIDPSVSVWFEKCGDVDCQKPQIISVSADVWTTNATLKQAKTILQSFSFR